jgi:ABC-2 type transport system permease protein
MLDSSTFTGFWGALRYEFTMQARRKALWIGMLLLALFLLRNFTYFYFGGAFTSNGRAAVIEWTSFMANFFPIAIGLLLADRLVRDGKLHVDELLLTTPAPRFGWLISKYLGAVGATLLPILLVQVCGSALIALHWGDPGALLVGVAAFAATLLVSALFVGAFSIACTTFLWPLLYQFLFVGYWFWGNFLNSKTTGIPTLNGTPLTSDGRFVLAGLLPLVASTHQPSVPVSQALVSLGALLGCAALALVAAHFILRWQAARG